MEKESASVGELFVSNCKWLCVGVLFDSFLGTSDSKFLTILDQKIGDLILSAADLSMFIASIPFCIICAQNCRVT